MTAQPRYTPFTSREGDWNSALERYAAVSAEIVGDIQRRHDAHKARLQAAGDRIDRFIEHTRSQMGEE
jgi:hypothetical protein